MKIKFELIDDDGSLYEGEVTLSPKRRSQERKMPAVRPAKLTCPAVISGLWQKQVFTKPLSFPEIKNELSNKGFNFPDNTLMMALAKTKFLTRRGSKGSYIWQQKHPHNG